MDSVTEASCMGSTTVGGVSVVMQSVQSARIDRSEPENARTPRETLFGRLA